MHSVIGPFLCDDDVCLDMRNILHRYNLTKQYFVCSYSSEAFNIWMINVQRHTTKLLPIK